MTQVTLTVRAEINEVSPGVYDVALGRLVDGRLFPLANLRGLSPAAVFTTTGVKVTVPPKRPDDPIAAAKEILREALDNLPTSGVLSRDAVVNSYLDTLNELGHEGEENVLYVQPE